MDLRRKNTVLVNVYGTWNLGFFHFFFIQDISGRAKRIHHTFIHDSFQVFSSNFPGQFKAFLIIYLYQIFFLFKRLVGLGKIFKCIDVQRILYVI